MSPQKLAIDALSNLYISDGTGVVWFVDSRTAFIRPIAGNTTTTCNPTASPNIGDGCPAIHAIIGDGGNGIGVGNDTLGNLYISDTLNARIRKVSTGLQFPPTADAASTTQTLDLHFIAGDTPATTPLAYTSTEWTLSTPTCTTNSDTTTDCLVSAKFTPVVPGSRSTPLSVSSAAGNTALLGLTGTGLGAGATLDPAARSTFGTNLKPAAVAVDTAGNVLRLRPRQQEPSALHPCGCRSGSNRDLHHPRHPHRARPHRRRRSRLRLRRRHLHRPHHPGRSHRHRLHAAVQAHRSGRPRSRRPRKPLRLRLLRSGRI